MKYSVVSKAVPFFFGIMFVMICHFKQKHVERNHDVYIWMLDQSESWVQYMGVSSPSTGLLKSLCRLAVYRIFY